MKVETKKNITIYSDIDNSAVEYSKDNQKFQIEFDATLYEPPQSVVRHEKKLEDEKLKAGKP